MFYHDRKTQYHVRVDKPNPMYAKMLQQALGGIGGEEPSLGPPIPQVYAQAEEMQGSRARVTKKGGSGGGAPSRLAAGAMHLMDDLRGGPKRS